MIFQALSWLPDLAANSLNVTSYQCPWQRSNAKRQFVVMYKWNVATSLGNPGKSSRFSVFILLLKMSAGVRPHRCMGIPLRLPNILGNLWLDRIPFLPYGKKKFQLSISPVLLSMDLAAKLQPWNSIATFLETCEILVSILLIKKFSS